MNKIKSTFPLQRMTAYNAGAHFELNLQWNTRIVFSLLSPLVLGNGLLLSKPNKNCSTAAEVFKFIAL
jgi:hypothetical protein